MKNEIINVLYWSYEPNMILKEYQKITIINYPIPRFRNLNEELIWLGSSLGLFSLRDKDKSMFRIFIELLKSAKKNIPISSDEIAESLSLSRGTVVHHINKLLSFGLVVTKNNRYILRVDNLSELIDELEKDAMDTLKELKEIAKDIDKRLGI
jgi:predicted transcriptional regulator